MSGILGSLGTFGALLLLLHRKASLNAEKSAAMGVMAEIHEACLAFYEEYQTFPLGHTMPRDIARSTAGTRDNILPSLCPPNGSEESSKFITFFDDEKVINKDPGLFRREGHHVDLYDPWGSPYHVLFDYDYDRMLRDPFSEKMTENTQILIWSLGPDGESGTPETDEDNLYSWSRKTASRAAIVAQK